MAKGGFDLASAGVRRFDRIKDVADLIHEITSNGPRYGGQS